MKKSKKKIISILREKTGNKLADFTNRDVYRGYIYYKFKNDYHMMSVADLPRIDLDSFSREVGRVSGSGFCIIK